MSPVPFQVRAGEQFSVRILGDGFDTQQDKIILIPSDASCRSTVPPAPGAASTPAEYAQVMCDGGGSAATVLMCEGLSVYAKGTWTACVCDHDGNPNAALPEDYNASTTNAPGVPSSGCTVRERYYLNPLGVVHVDGPSYAGVLQRRIGARKNLVLSGTRLSSMDRIRIVDGSVSCSNPSISKAMHAAVSGQWPAVAPVGERDLGGNGYTESWRDVSLDSPGTYHVCWCGAGFGGCDSNEDFLVHAATLVVKGPDPAPQPQRCVTGVRCTVAVSGTGLSIADRIRIISSTRTCGTAQTSSSVLQGGSGDRTSGDDGISRWGGVIIGSSGSYTICWCGRNDLSSCPNCCASSVDFNVHVGEITAGGPDQGQYDRPRFGLPFTYSITGWGLSGIDRISIVDPSVQCATSGAAVMSTGIWPNSAPVGPPAEMEGEENNGTRVSWRGIIIVRMQDYRVCWCARYTGNCQSGEHFALDIGLITPLGPRNTTNMNVVPNRPFALTVNAATGSKMSRGDRIRIVSHDITHGVCGTLGTSHNSDAVADMACWPVCRSTAHTGPPALENSNTTARWDPVLITQSGLYDVCWCNDGMGGCDSDDDFLVKVAHIVATGVSRGHTWHCADSMPCVLSMQQSGGASPGDVIQMIPFAPDAVCGITERADGAGFSRGSRIAGLSGTASDGRQLIVFDLGIPTTPGAYKVCYCQGQNVCGQDLDFFQDTGSLTVSGIAARDQYHVCYLRGRCDLSITGTGLNENDALMLVGFRDSCGVAGEQARTGFTGEGFYANAGFTMYISTFAGTSDDGLERWDFKLGTPSLVGHFRVCYCSAQRASRNLCSTHRDFDQAAGEVFVRGTELSQPWLCTQGEACELVMRAQQFDSMDRIFLFHENHTCGDTDPGSWTHWMAPTAPVDISDDVIIPEMLMATYRITAVREPGRYRVCYCAYIRGGTSCVSPNNGDPQPRHHRFVHEAGTLRVTGAITRMREIATPAPLPSTPYAASAEVEALMTGVHLTCVATRFAAPTGFLPQMSDLQNCTLPRDSRFLSPRQRIFPQCLGSFRVPDAVTQTGKIHVHVPLSVSPSEARTISQLHMWCYAAEECANDRCVMPASSSGAVLPFTQGLERTDDQWSATVGTAFSLRVKLADDFAIGRPWPRVKIVRQGEQCDRSKLLPGVSGITCVDSSIGKCEPEPASVLTSGVLGNSRELIWQNVVVPTIGEYDVCYCDRHFGQACLLWMHIGALDVNGPYNVGSLLYWGNPGVPFEVAVQGSGLQRGDRLRIVPDGNLCTSRTNGYVYPPGWSETIPPPREATTTAVVAPGTSETTTTSPIGVSTTASNGTRRLATAWGPYPPIIANGTFQRWEGQLDEMGTYSVCWCGADSHSCANPEDFTVKLGKMRIAERVDCELTDWWVAQECDRPCGGGEVYLRRAVRRRESGGGSPCPSLDDLAMTQQCNMEPCPLARVDIAWTEPSTLRAGLPFVIHVEGHWFDPTEDRILLVGEDTPCGSTQAHYGGASCAQPGGSERHLICGDGHLSIRVQRPGSYRVCFCDASAAVVRNHDGSGNVSSGSFAAIGLTGSGCADAGNYILMPADEGLLEVVGEDAPAPGPVAAGSQGLGVGVIVALTGLSAALLVVSCVGVWCCCRSRRRRQKMAVAQEPLDDLVKLEEEVVKVGVTPPGMDPQTLQWYETYYQSLGYPPGTATQVLAGPSAMQALPAPAPAQPEMYQQQQQWLALQNAPQPPAMVPLQLPAPMQSASPRTPPPPPTPPMPPPGRARSPRTSTVSPRASFRRESMKSFGDLVKDVEKRQSVSASASAPAFTDMDLSPMPTPTCTPRGCATPRESQASQAPLAIEDGAEPQKASGAHGQIPSHSPPQPAVPSEPAGFKSPRGFGPASPEAPPPRPETAESSGSDHDDRVSLALSESSAGVSLSSPMPSRPNSGDPEAAPPPADGDKVPRLTQSVLESHDSAMLSQSPAPVLTPVKEESEGEDSPSPTQESRLAAMRNEKLDEKPPGQQPEEAKEVKPEEKQEAKPEEKQEAKPEEKQEAKPVEKPKEKPPEKQEEKSEVKQEPTETTTPRSESSRTPRQLSAFLNGRLSKLLGSSSLADGPSAGGEGSKDDAAKGEESGKASEAAAPAWPSQTISKLPSVPTAAKAAEQPTEAPAAEAPGPPVDDLRPPTPLPPPGNAWASRPTTPAFSAPPPVPLEPPPAPLGPPESEAEAPESEAGSHDDEARPVTPIHTSPRPTDGTSEGRDAPVPPTLKPMFPFFNRPGDVEAQAPGDAGAPLPPPPPGKPPRGPGGLPGPPLAVETDLDDTIHSSDSSGWKAPSLGSLHQSMQNRPASPAAFLSEANDASGSGAPPPPPGRPPRGPGGPAGPGPALSVETDLEDTLHSVGSLLSAGSGSPSGARRKVTLAGMASSSASAAKGVKAPTPNHSKPKRAVVAPRAPQAFDRPDVAPPPPPMSPAVRKGP